MPEYDYVAQQLVLDSALRLLACRSQALDDLRHGRGNAGETGIVSTGPDLTAWTMRESHKWRELLSTRPVTSALDLSRSLPNNRQLLANGLRMRSVFDHGGTEPDALRLLTGEQSDHTYFIGLAPLQMRIVDGTSVLLNGAPGTTSILRLSSTQAVSAAMTHWDAVLSHAHPCDALKPSAVSALSSRQLMTLELLKRGSTDRTIAATLGVSVRTVQNEVTALMELYDVRSRFALGYEYAAGHARDTNGNR